MANTLAACAFLQLMLPALLQIRRFISTSTHMNMPLQEGWHSETWTFLTLGMPWSSDQPENPLIHAVGNLGRLEPIGMIVVFGLIPLLMVLGGILAWRRSVSCVLMLSRSDEETQPRADNATKATPARYSTPAVARLPCKGNASSVRSRPSIYERPLTTKRARRFCCQQRALLSSQKGRSSP